jgi:SAM-dependent methyltransferase
MGKRAGLVYSSPTKGWLEAIRRDWDMRAREDAHKYINWPDVPPGEDAFFASGLVDYRRFVTPFFERMAFGPRGKVALEIGCGTGRIARHMAGDFGQYVGVDVSPEMIRKASAYGFPSATFLCVSGSDLAGIANDSVDFVFSFAVFQHVPDKCAILNYVAETARVLRPGGFFRLQMKGLWAIAAGRFAIEAGFSNSVWMTKAGLTRVPFVRLRHLDTWQGHSIRPAEAIRHCESHGLEVLDVEGKWTTKMWMGGRKR